MYYGLFLHKLVIYTVHIFSDIRPCIHQGLLVYINIIIHISYSKTFVAVCLYMQQISLSYVRPCFIDISSVIFPFLVHCLSYIHTWIHV